MPIVLLPQRLIRRLPLANDDPSARPEPAAGFGINII
jgi:hypothetical protein